MAPAAASSLSRARSMQLREKRRSREHRHEWRSQDSLRPQLEPSSKATDWPAVRPNRGTGTRTREKKASAAKVAPCALLVRCASTNPGLSDQPFGGVAGHVEALGAVVMQPPSTSGLAAAGDGYQRGLSGRYRRINSWTARYPRDSFGRCGAGGMR